MADEVLTQVDHRGVATVTLNRPEVNNAYNDAMLHGLHEAVDAALVSRGTEQPVRCVVVRGDGKHFQAGADLRWLARVQQGNVQQNHAASELTGGAVRRLTELDVPVVALV